MDDAVELLEETLEEEKAADEKLNRNSPSTALTRRPMARATKVKKRRTKAKSPSSRASSRQNSTSHFPRAPACSRMPFAFRPIPRLHCRQLRRAVDGMKSSALAGRPRAPVAHKRGCQAGVILPTFASLGLSRQHAVEAIERYATAEMVDVVHTDIRGEPAHHDRQIVMRAAMQSRLMHASSPCLAPILSLRTGAGRRKSHTPIEVASRMIGT